MPERALVYGAGRVGLGVASCLAAAGVRVDIIARPATVNALRAEGLIRTGIFGRSVAPPGSLGAWASLADRPAAKCDYVLVCTKTSDCAAAAEDICAYDKALGRPVTVLFQNGWGSAEQFRRLFAADRIYNARVITGFARPAANIVDVTVHAEAIHLGSLFGADLSPVGRLATLITAGGIPCETTESIGCDMWAKMLYNCALNPLGAILNVPYGKLGECESTRMLMGRIVSEAFAVMTAEGYQTHWASPEDFLAAFYEHMLPPTAAHRSSMLQDIESGKATEIDAMSGQVMRLAAKHGLAAPTNETVYYMVRFMERGTESDVARRDS